MGWTDELFRTESSRSPSKPVPLRHEVASVAPSYASSRYTDCSIRPSASGSGISVYSPKSSRQDSLLTTPMSLKPQPRQYVSPLAAPSSPLPQSAVEDAQDIPLHRRESELSIKYDNGYGHLTPGISKQVNQKGKSPRSIEMMSNLQGFTSGGLRSHQPPLAQPYRYAGVQDAKTEGEEDRLFEALLEETKHMMPDAISEPYAYHEHQKLLIQYVLSCCPSIRCTVATIQRAHHTAVQRPLITKRNFHARQGSHLRAGLNKADMYRKAKGETERNIIHDMSQRVKRVPKYADVLDDTDRYASLMTARALWIREWNFFLQLYPRRSYGTTFQDRRRHREGRHLKSRKIACAFDDSARIDKKTGNPYFVPLPKEATGRETAERERKIAKGGLRGAILKLGRSSATAVQPPSQHTKARNSEVSTRPSKTEQLRNPSFKGRETSIFHGKDEHPERARTNFVNRGRKGKAKISRDYAHLPAHQSVPSQAPTSDSASEENPWWDDPEDETNDPCSLNYRRKKR